MRLLILVVLAAALIGIATVLLSQRRARTDRLTRTERAELANLRLMRDRVLDQCVDAMTVEPFALQVHDTIRNTQREINQ